MLLLPAKTGCRVREHTKVLGRPSKLNSPRPVGRLSGPWWRGPAFVQQHGPEWGPPSPARSASGWESSRGWSPPPNRTDGTHTVASGSPMPEALLPTSSRARPPLAPAPPSLVQQTVRALVTRPQLSKGRCTIFTSRFQQLEQLLGRRAAFARMSVGGNFAGQAP